MAMAASMGVEAGQNVENNARQENPDLATERA